MAEQYDNTNRFALFKNNKTKDSQPDYTGTITLEGGKGDVIECMGKRI